MRSSGSRCWAFDFPAPITVEFKEPIDESAPSLTIRQAARTRLKRSSKAEGPGDTTKGEDSPEPGKACSEAQLKPLLGTYHLQQANQDRKIGGVPVPFRQKSTGDQKGTIVLEFTSAQAVEEIPADVFLPRTPRQTPRTPYPGPHTSSLRGCPCCFRFQRLSLTILNGRLQNCLPSGLYLKYFEHCVLRAPLSKER